MAEAETFIPREVPMNEASDSEQASVNQGHFELSAEVSSD